MQTEHTTRGGYRLEIGRIDRAEFDKFSATDPMPRPPVKTARELGIEVFGDGAADDELIVVHGDSAYLAEMYRWQLAFWDRRLDVAVGAIKLLDPLDESDLAEIDDLTQIAIDVDNPADLLRYVVLTDDDDAADVVGIVMYNSTVTSRGVLEATERFGVAVNNKPVTGSVESSNLIASREFGDRRAALYCRIPWGEFSQQTGPEQSAHVAFHRINLSLENRAWRKREKGHKSKKR